MFESKIEKKKYLNHAQRDQIHNFNVQNGERIHVYAKVYTTFVEVF